MIYVTSDLHGCPPEEFRALLGRAGVTDEDFVFILGDVIDRGEWGVELLVWLCQQPNMELILGNHEAMLLACGFLFEEVTEESLAALTGEKLAVLNDWLMNGGETTLEGLRRLKRKDPEMLEGVLEYLREAPLYEEVEAGGKRFVLVHAGLENFAPEKPLEDYLPEELLFGRPELATRYYPDAVVVFGHTPTHYWGAQYRGKALKGEGWVCIDTGAADGGSPMLLRLEDMQEFY